MDGQPTILFPRSPDVDNKVFETEVLPIATRYIGSVFGRNEELASIALSLTWYQWHTYGHKGLPPSCYIQVAVRQVLSGRDVPGVVSSVACNAWKRTTVGAMKEVRDRRPGPDRLVGWREEFAVVYPTLGRQQRRLVDLMREEILDNQELAARLGVTEGRVSQLRRKVMERFRERERS